MIAQEPTAEHSLQADDLNISGSARTFKEAAWKLVRKVSARGDFGVLKLLPAECLVDHPTIEVLFEELRSSVELKESLGAPLGRRGISVPPKTGEWELLQDRLNLEGSGRARALLLYVVARLLRPEVVVETGCFTGWDSALLLMALDRNQQGHLYSIDLPATQGQFSQIGSDAALPPDVPTGFLVPEPLRGRWTLIMADVVDELPNLLDRLGDIDLFFHDSHHSYAHMMWEYTTVWPHLADHGILVSDDVAWNTAFWDFAWGVRRSIVMHRSSRNVAAIGSARWTPLRTLLQRP